MFPINTKNFSTKLIIFQILTWLISAPGSSLHLRQHFVQITFVFFIYSNKFIHKEKNKEAVLWGFLYPQNMANFMLSNKDRKKCLEIEYGHTSSV